MTTILEPKAIVSNLWGKQQVKDKASYRLLKYVLRIEQDDKVLLHNVVTGQLVVLEEDEKKMLDTLPAPYDPSMGILIAEHYLVPVGFDEYRSVNQLRKICQSSSRGDAINHYIILPTTFCNAHCFYCYESDYPRVQMSEETAARLIDYIHEHRKGRDVAINWFGGEPLLGIGRIDQISQGMKDRGIPFSSSMISNGYLFDEEIVERSVELWKLQRIQITLDGTEETYNRVKAYKTIQDNPYQRVLRNIDLLSSKKVHVNIRLNVDLYNKDNIQILIEELGERYSDNLFVTVYLNMLFNNQGYEPVSHSYDDMLALTDVIGKYTKRLKELKLAFDNWKYLSLAFSQCMADNPHSVMIQPDGSFCRCEHESIFDSYGSIEKGVTDQKKLDEWHEIAEPSAKCPECAVYPACYHLRHCMNNDVPCTDDLQRINLETQMDRVRSIYVKKMEEMNDERV